MQTRDTEARKRSRSRGLTRIEVLAVLGCLLCLAPILLAGARSVSRPNREVMCAFRLSQLGAAMLQYTADHGGYLPGSPGTTGTELILEYGDAEPDEVDIPTDVTQTWDWAAPLAGYLGVPLDPNRSTRSEQLRHGFYWCPANGYEALPYHNGEFGPFPNWPAMRMVSYNAMRMMLYYESGDTLDPSVRTYAWWRPWLSIDLPPGYEPRLDLIGPPSEKLFLSDGARFTSSFGGTYEVRALSFYGGSFADGGPTISAMWMHAYDLDPARAPRTYRHPHGTELGLNALHCDGHVEWVSEPDSRQPDRWYPSGTRIFVSAMNIPTYVSVCYDLDEDGAYTVP
ncbi:MAG TPA: hypothetical protein VM487_20300 [Phycisphaerae bacterium]|nr:hypothetical protein [Phycisphaerae bacterium]